MNRSRMLRRFGGLVFAAAFATCIAPPFGTADAAAAADDAPTTRPAATPVRPDDLQPAVREYVIGPGDLVRVSIADLTGPGKETIKDTRVGPTGVIALPFVNNVAVGGRTEGESQQLIAKAFHSGNIVAHANVSVTVVESVHNNFTVLGSAAVKPGVYPVPRPDFRLLDALAHAQVDVEGGQLLVLRSDAGPAPEKAEKAKADAAPAQARRIEVDVNRLLDGDASQNLVIRPGDAILAKASGPRALRVIVGAEGVLRLGGGGGGGAKAATSTPAATTRPASDSHGH